MNVVVTHNVLDADGFMTGGAVLVERRRHLRVASRAGTLTINGIVVGPIFGSTAPTGAPEANGRIAPHHLQMLLASGIPPEHAHARGYETITDSRRLAPLALAGTASH